MYVATVPNRNSPPAILLRESYREDGKVKTRTVENITHWNPARIEAMRRTLRGDFDDLPADADPVSGLIFGVLFTLKRIADRLGIPQIMGGSRPAKLALFLVLARIAHQGSRLSAVRWAEDHAVEETLDLKGFDEDDLYAALDWLGENQEEIENSMFRAWFERSDKPLSLMLYDVTSSYFEGEHNELGEFGYNRDGKKGKKQIVIGLLTAPDGEPLAVRVFRGNTVDPLTVGAQIDALKKRFGVEEVVFVGDRGMIKAKGKQALAENGLKYISALTDAQVRKLLKQNVIQPELFDKELTEVEHDGKRLVMRLNEQVRKKEAHRREDKLEKLQQKIEERNKFVADSKRADPEAGLRRLEAWAGRHRLKSFAALSLDDGKIKCEIDEEAKSDAALLDGCYVLETDVAQAKMDTAGVDAGYRSLQRVERDFRRMKTTLLEVRPIFLRKGVRTRAHVFAAVLALKISREMESRLHDAFGADEDGKQIMTIEDALRALSRLSFLICKTPGGETTRLPRVDERQAAILAALGVHWNAGRGRRRAEPGRKAAGRTAAKTERPTV